MRTIILQEVATPSGSSTYWAINENGRIIEGLGTDELLWAAACVLMSREWPYRGGETIEGAKEAAYKQGVIEARAGQVPAGKDPNNDVSF
jgi:uncharacterized membrane protein